MTPAGAATVAVFVRIPVAEWLTAATTVKVAVPPGRSVTVVAMSPLPEEAATLEPVDAVAVQVADTAVGMTSFTLAAVATEGPPFVTTIV